MKWKDSNGIVETEEAKEELFEEEHYSPWAERKDIQWHRRLLKMKPQFLIGGSAALAVLVVLIILVAAGGGTIGNSELADLQDRLFRLEERLSRYDTTDEKLNRIWEQAKTFEKFKERFDRSEASMSLRMDHLSVSVEALEKKIGQAPVKPAARPQAAPAPAPAGAPAAAAPAPAAAPAKKIRYHQVSSGDTFFSISKHYNVSVDELLRLNRLKEDSVLMPGQKLIVRTD